MQTATLYLHDLAVHNLRTSTFGIFVDAVEFGETFCVFKVSEAKNCIRQVPVTPAGKCENCDWRRIKEVIHL